jgi:vancomycin resistance protein YoaR
LWVGATVVVVLLFIGVAERIGWRGRVMPGVKIAALDVSGQRELTAYASITKFARHLDATPISATAAGHHLAVAPTSVHFRVDARATLRRAREAGRSGNPFEQVLGTFLRRLRPDRVDPVVTFDGDEVDAAVDRWGAEVNRGVNEGGLRFEGTEVVEVAPTSGTGINQDEAKVELVSELLDGSRAPIHLSYGPTTARTTKAQVDAVARQARAILGHGIRVTSSGHRFTATPAQIASALQTQVDGDRLSLAVDPLRLQTALAPQLAPIGVAPVSARFEVTPANTVVVVPSHDGLQPDLARVGRAILADRTAVDVPLVRHHPVRDTAWANRLGITEQVSSFTTHYVPGQSRVTNIHLAADIMNNTVVGPGQVFSLNATVGPRTPQRGFVKAPVYYDGEAEDYGGGVSQIATTTYNAAFWGGFENVFHQPHTIYYSRYPLGREATVNYPVLDLKWRNNSHHGVLLRATYSSNSVTITLYGNKEGKVVKEESTNCSSTSPTQRCVDIVKATPFPTLAVRCPPKDPKVDPNNSCALLKPNERLDTAEGHTGYDVTYFRVIDQPGHREIRERHSWHYAMLPDIILVGAVPPGTATTGPNGTTPVQHPKTTTTIP